MNIPLYVDLKAISYLLTTERIGRVSAPNEVWDEIGSTNDRAAELAALGAPEGVLVFARQQTAGRGRLGRNWVSPVDAGINMSCVMRPKLPPHQLPVYTLAVGVACVRAVLSCAEVEIGLKWVNDLVYGGKKLGGVLCERQLSASGEPAEAAPPAVHAAADSMLSGNDPAVIVGIGINVHSIKEAAGLPPDLASSVEWLDRIAGHTINLNVLAAALADELESVADTIAGEQMAELLDEWRSYSVTLDKQIVATVGDQTIEGRAEDINEEGALLVSTRSGQVVRLQAGEISIRTADGYYY